MRKLRSNATPFSAALAAAALAIPLLAGQDPSARTVTPQEPRLPPPAPSATEIRPLLVGTTPSMDARVHSVEGEEMTLGRLLDEQRTILVFYRGSW